MTEDSPDDMKIAGRFTVADWKAMKTALESDKSNPKIWKLAFEVFFITRIEARYFEPIRLLQKHGEDKGEGFSIVALQCSLIEFLSSLSDNENCCCNKKTDADKCQTCHLNIISGSKRFVDFLRKENGLFKKELSSSNKARSFYDDVRCALLHDARTKGKWKILAKSKDKKIVNWKGTNSEKILYRDNLQKAFEQYVVDYGKELEKCSKLQDAFTCKFNSLCKE